MDLVAEVGSDRSDEQVQSDEAEGAFVLLPVLPDVGPLHETHVRVVDQAVSGRGRCTEPAATAAGRDRPLALEVVDADHAAEIGDGRGFEPLGVVVDVNQVAVAEIDTAGDRFRRGPVGLGKRSPGQVRPGPEGDGRGSGGLEESAPRGRPLPEMSASTSAACPR